MDVLLEEYRRVAEESVRAAYAAGRISASEYDRRLGMVALAGSPTEVSQVFDRQVRHPSGFSMFPYATGLIGPLGPAVAYHFSKAGTSARRSAVYALNFQLWLLAVLVLTVVVTTISAASVVWLFVELLLLFPVATVLSIVAALVGRPVELPPHPKWQKGWAAW